MRIKLVIVICLFLPTFSHGSSTLLLARMIQLHAKDIAIVLEKLQNSIGSATTLLRADKQQTGILTNVYNSLYKFRENLKGEVSFGAIEGNAGGFKIGGIIPSGCISYENNNIAQDVVVNVKPVSKELKEEMKSRISTESPSFKEIERRGAEVADIIVQDGSKSVVNPFSLNRNISESEFLKLSKIIEYMVNVSPPTSMPQPNKIGSDYERQSKRIRYEMFVDIVQNALMDRVSHYVVGDSGSSERDLILRLIAKSNAKDMSKSMTAKYKDGITREINTTLSDLLAIDVMINEVRKSNLALNTVITTGITDKMAKDL